MIRFILTVLLALSVAHTSHAQIYADVTVSHGESSLGTFRIQLHHELAPRTVANFIGLATGQRAWIDPQTGSLQINQPYYDGLIFHRLDHDFVIQGGDPLGTGGGGPGYVFQDEFHPSLSHEEYAVSMANSGPSSNGSQFFINLSAPTFLDNKHSVFGLVIDDATYPNSRSLIDSFKSSTNFPTTSDRPDTDITIESVTISGPDLASFDINDPALSLPEVSALPMGIVHDFVSGEFSLAWEAQRKFDYPLYYSTDLENWSLAGKALSMDEDPAFDIGIDAIATEPSGFYKSTQVDYTSLIEAPQNILANGTVLNLTSNGGTLRLTFDGAGSGSWRFIYDDGTTPDETGLIASSNQTNDIDSYPVIPTSGVYVNGSGQTYARFLSVRQITVFLGDETGAEFPEEPGVGVGPDFLTAVQPALSFHETASGWFDALVNDNTTEIVTFRGPFTITTE